ncbi:MAG: HesA/MoeB/ThiF family protein [Promethearchaeota archaeon]|nr:MAG: HesA/MoeB/ThiF family protein [Candidatus Lokiarchaeota archaeon]
MTLTEEQINRYSRQIVLKEIGGIGQKKLLNSKITLIGLGALGSPVAYYLVAAGIGNLKVIDYDSVELSNLHRQILHFTKDINRKKTESAIEKLNLLNPDCKIDIIPEKITPENAKDILKSSDFVIEGSDNFPTKMLINDACVYLKIPFTIAGVLRFHGQIMTIAPEKKTACYRCLFGDITDVPTGMSCSEAGVIGLIPGILGCIEANEAIKCILNIGDLITNKIMYIDLLRNAFNFIDIYRDENCIACGENAKDLVETYNYRIEEVCR